MRETSAGGAEARDGGTGSGEPELPRLSVISYVVLGLIGLRGPSTSYDLKRAISHSVGYFWPFPHAQLYSEPQRLTAAGLLTVSTEEGGRRRRTYDLSDKGRQAVRAWLAEPVAEQMQVRDIAELKLFFAELGEDGDVRRLALSQVDEHTERIRVYEDIALRFADQEDVAARMVPLRLGLAMERAVLEVWEEIVAETAPAATPSS